MCIIPNLCSNLRLEGSVGEWEFTWSETKEFSQILISPFMMRHHFPPVVMAALRDAADQAADPT